MGIGIKELAIILVIVLLVFGTKKLRNMGGDLGSAIKNFKKSMSEADHETQDDPPQPRSVENRTDAQTTAHAHKEHNTPS